MSGGTAAATDLARTRSDEDSPGVFRRRAETGLQSKPQTLDDVEFGAGRTQVATDQSPLLEPQSFESQVSRATLFMLACLTSAMSMIGLVRLDSWVWTMLAMVAASGVIVALAALVLKRLVAKVAVALGVGLLLNVAVLVFNVTKYELPARLPRDDSLLGLAAAYLRRVISVSWTTLPPAADTELFAPAITLVMSVLTLFAFALFLLCDAQFVGIALLVTPWLVVGFQNPNTPIGWALVFAAAVVVVLAFGSPSVRLVAVLRRRAVAFSAALLCASVAIAGVVTPLVPSLPGYGSLLQAIKDLNIPGVGPGPGSGSGVGSDGSRGIGIPGDFNLETQLVEQDHTPLFQVRGDYRGFLKVTSYYDFLGSDWVATDSSASTRVEGGFPTWSPEGTGHAFHGELVTFSISSEPDNLVLAHRLLISGPRVVVSPVAGLRYNRVTDSLDLSEVAIPSGRDVAQWQYVTSIDTSLLTSRIPSIQAVLSDEWLARAVALPEGIDETYIRDLALSLTDGYATQHDKLQALIAYLNGPHFSYTLTPDLSSTRPDPVSAFLEKGDGYCIHFATALIVMGRTLGIPMRAGVGYLQVGGEDDEWRSISSAEAHMWAEAYFPGTGWVPYEATKSSGSGGNGVPPSGSPSPSPSASTTPSATPSDQNSASASVGSQDPSSSASPTVGGAGADSGAGHGWWFYVSIFTTGAVALAGGLCGGFALRRRRCTPEGAWALILRRLRPNLHPAEDETLRQVAARIIALIDHDENAHRLLDALVAQLEAQRYAPPPARAFTWSQSWDTLKAVSRAASARHAG